MTRPPVLPTSPRTWAGGQLPRVDEISYDVKMHTTALAQDPEGGVWIGTDAGGLGVAYHNDHGVTSFNEASGLGNSGISSILVGREGHIWFGSLGSGVSRYDGERYRHYLSGGSAASHDVRDLIIDRSGVLWMAHDKGVHRYDGTTLEPFPEADSLGTTGVRQLYEDRQGRIWFAPNNTLMRSESLSQMAMRRPSPGPTTIGFFDGDSLHTIEVEDGIDHGSIYCILQDHRDHLWFGTSFTSQNGGPAFFDDLRVTSGAADTFICNAPPDGDGVLDSDDACSGTVIPEFVPTAKLGVNRWALVDGDGLFDTTPPKGKGPKRSYTIADTRGCSCEQIIAAQGLGKGHAKFGCSISAMDAAVAGGAAPKPAVGAEATSWGEIKRQQQQE